MAERILPIEEEPGENPNLVGTVDDDETLVGVAGEEEEEGEDLSDLFEVPKQGVEKEDISDVFEVGEEDIMGEEEPEEGIEDLFEVGEEKEETEDDEAKLEEEGEQEAPHWSDEDIKRYEKIQKQQQAKKPVYQRTTKRYIPPQIGRIE